MHPEDREKLSTLAKELRLARTRSFITKESREKTRLALTGRKRSEETKEKIRQKALGRKHSEETKEKIRLARKVQKVTPKMLEALANNRGENGLLWKGNYVGYRALHRWVEKHLGKPTQCSHCDKIELQGHNIHWANKSGEYKRELSDWIRLCALCHKKFDNY